MSLKKKLLGNRNRKNGISVTRTDFFKYFFISFTKEISSLSLDLERQMLTFLHVWRSAV